MKPAGVPCPRDTEVERDTEPEPVVQDPRDLLEVLQSYADEIEDPKKACENMKKACFPASDTEMGQHLKAYLGDASPMDMPTQKKT